MGHHPVVPPRILPSAPRVSEELLASLAGAYVPDLSDALGPLYTMGSEIRPLYQPTPRLIGQALTVKAPPGDNLTIHGALTMVQKNDVLVIDWRGHLESCGTGSHALAVPTSWGLSGVVVDGGWRDIGELRAVGFPIFGRGVSPFSPPKNRPGEINVPVSCGGVIVEPGDIVVGDEEGVAIVPLRWAELVASAVAAKQEEPDQDTELDERLVIAMDHRRQYFRRVVQEHGGDVPD